MTDIYLHIYARMADYIRTHTYEVIFVLMAAACMAYAHRGGRVCVLADV